MRERGCACYERQRDRDRQTDRETDREREKGGGGGGKGKGEREKERETDRQIMKGSVLFLPFFQQELQVVDQKSIFSTAATFDMLIRLCQHTTLHNTQWNFVHVNKY